MLSLLLWTLPATADRVRILVQNSPLAGSQYHDLTAVRPRMKVGDRLTLTREPGNRHDVNAIIVEWQGHKLGYLPRAENRVVASAMDSGNRLSARVSRLDEDPDPWRQVEVEIYLDL